MDIRLSMVHNNPGEKNFDTKFNNPEILSDYGFNGQVFKHIDAIVTFDSLGHDFFPKGSPEREWQDEYRIPLIEEIRKAKKRDWIHIIISIFLFCQRRLLTFIMTRFVTKTGRYQ